MTRQSEDQIFRISDIPILRVFRLSELIDLVWYDCDMIIGIDASRAFVRDKTGTENYSYHLIKAILRLPESQKHVFVLFTRPNAIMPTELALYSNVIIKEVKWRYLWTQVGLAWATWGKFSNHKFSNSQIDVLWVPAHTLPVLRNPRVKTVVTIHGLEYQWLPEYKNLLQRWYLPLSTFYAAKSADRLIAVSKFSAKQLVEATQIDKKKIKVILEGVSFGQSENSENQSISSSDNQIYQKFGIVRKQYLLFVGSIQPRKNLPALIEAFSLFSRSNPDYQLVLAGGTGWMAEDIFMAPGRFGVQEKVVFTGRVSDLELSKLYLGAMIYVQPSITEGFGLPVLEAMAHGVPVISSDGGALSEVVGDAGVIVPITNRKFSNSPIRDNFALRLAGAMKILVSDKKLQNRLIAMGYERVKEFSWEKAGRATLQILVG